MFKLITQATGAEAYQLKATLSGDILLGDFMELPEVMLKSGKMIRLPDPKDPAYLHKMLALCLDSQISEIFPLNVLEQELLKQSIQLFSEYNINIHFNELR